MGEIWGGVGISCFEWNPIDKNVVAIVTKKTNKLEIWAVDQGRMIGIMDLKVAVSLVKWNPHNPAQLIALEKSDNAHEIARKILYLDYTTNVQKVLSNVMVNITTIGWHPRRPDFVVLGTGYGQVSITNITTQVYDAMFVVPQKVQGSKVSAMVQDIIFSPGEDVFLVIRVDGQIFLYSAEQQEPKAEFEKP